MATRTFPEQNQQDTLNFQALEAKSIDYTSRFGQNFSKFVEALGITRQIPVQEGFTIKLYGAPEVDLADGNVPEGELIPLSKVNLKRNIFHQIKAIGIPMKFGMKRIPSHPNEVTWLILNMIFMT